MNPDSGELDITDSSVADLLEGAFAAGGSFGADGSMNQSRAADLLWINSLTELALQVDSTRRDKRIERAMQAIRGAVAASEVVVGEVASAATAFPRPVTRSMRSCRAVVWVTTAVLLVGAAVLMQTANPRRQVHAAIDQIQQATALTDDREYRVTLTFLSPDDAIQKRPERKLEGTLFVRGGEAFVVRAPALLRAGDVWFGRDRNGAWFKPAVGPIQAGPTAVLMQQRFLRDTRDSAPFLQLTTVTNRLSESYDVRLLPEETAPGHSEAESSHCQHVLGTVRASSVSQSPWLPDRVEIHAESGTGTVRRLLLVWSRENASLLKQVEFHFVEQSKKPDNWYRPEGRNESQPVLR